MTRQKKDLQAPAKPRNGVGKKCICGGCLGPSPTFRPTIDAHNYQFTSHCYREFQDCKSVMPICSTIIHNTGKTKL